HRSHDVRSPAGKGTVGELPARGARQLLEAAFGETDGLEGERITRMEPDHGRRDVRPGPAESFDPNQVEPGLIDAIPRQKRRAGFVGEVETRTEQSPGLAIRRIAFRGLPSVGR